MDDERERVDELCEGVGAGRSEILSPTGRFRLVVQLYNTGQPAWSYSRGTVFEVSSGELVCDIRRNYPSFHHTFFNRGGSEWLIAGRSYMSQTIVCLDGRDEFSAPGDQYDESAFCWVACYPSPDGNILAVEGCHWACPWENRFFDFSDPSSGWPELAITGACDFVSATDGTEPFWIDDRTVECSESRRVGGPKAPLSVVAKTTLERRGDEMVAVEVWVAADEQKRRAALAAERAVFDAWRTEFCETDPLFLFAIGEAAQVGLPATSPAFGEPEGKKRVTFWFRRQAPKASADLIWIVGEGPIEVQLYNERGDRDLRPSFALDRDGMAAAIAAIAKAFV